MTACAIKERVGMARMRELPWLELQDRVRHVISVPVNTNLDQNRNDDG